MQVSENSTPRPSGLVARYPLLPHYVLLVTLAFALPVILIISFEAWTVSSYAGGMTVKGFNELYFSSIFRYRILGRQLVLAVLGPLSRHMADKPYPMPRDPQASYLLWTALGIVNGLAYFLANALFLGLLWCKRSGLTDLALATYLFYTLLLAISMVVVTPYDQIAYLLLLVGIWGARQRSLPLGLLLITVSSIAGSLNRETQFLLVAALAALALCSPRPIARRYWTLFAVALALSLGVYVAVRVADPGHLNMIYAVTYGGKWGAASLVLILILLAATAGIAQRIYPGLRPMLVFLFFSTPYIATVFLGGTLRELRLTVPVILCVFSIYLLLARDAEPQPTIS